MKKSKMAIVFLVGTCIALLFKVFLQKKLLSEINSKCNKFKKYYQLYNKWIQNMHFHISVEDRLLQKNIHSIAIYGCGEIGKRLSEELNNSNISVLYFLNQGVEDVSFQDSKGISIYNFEKLQTLPEVDAILITPIHEFDKIKRQLKELDSSRQAISIEEVLFA